VVWVPALKIYFTARGEGEKLVLTTIMDDPDSISKRVRTFGESSVCGSAKERERV